MMVDFGMLIITSLQYTVYGSLEAAQLECYALSWMLCSSEMPSCSMIQQALSWQQLWSTSTFIRQMTGLRTSPLRVPRAMEIPTPVSWSCEEGRIQPVEAMEVKVVSFPACDAKMAEARPASVPMTANRQNTKFSTTTFHLITLSSCSREIWTMPAPTPSSSACSELLIMATLLPAATPPATVLKTTSFRSIFPLMMQVRLIVVATQAEMQKMVFNPARQLRARDSGMSMLRKGKNTQQKREPIAVRKLLKLPAILMRCYLKALFWRQWQRMMEMVEPNHPAKQKIVIVPPKSKLQRLTNWRFSSYITVPNREITMAYRGPALPEMAAKVMALDNEHLRAWTAVSPQVLALMLLLLLKKAGILPPHDKLLLPLGMPTLVQNPAIRKQSWKVMAVMNRLNPNDDQSRFLPRLKMSPKPA